MPNIEITKEAVAHYKVIGILIGLAIAAGAVAYSMSSFGAKALECIARQPEASEDIKGSMSNPMMLMESLFVLTWIAGLLIISTKL